MVLFGPFALDIEQRELRRDGRLVGLSRKALDLLVLLLERRDHVVPKDELIRQLWPGESPSDSSLTTCVRRLRRALGDATGAIETHYGRGYRFSLPCTEETRGPDVSRAEDRHAPSLAGRDSETDILRESLSEARQARGTVHSIAGDFGMGKSTVLRNVASTADQAGFTSVWVSSGQVAADLPFSSWDAAFEVILDRIDQRSYAAFRARAAKVREMIRQCHDASPGDFEIHFRISDIAAQLLSDLAALTPILLAFDDFDRADPASIGLMSVWARLARDTATLTVFSVTTGDFPTTERLRDLHTRLLSVPGHIGIRLKPLPSESCWAIATHRAGGALRDDLRDRLVQDSGGNPLFVEALTDDWLANPPTTSSSPSRRTLPEVPDRLRSRLTTRLGALSPAARAALRIGAAIGDRIEVQLLARVLSSLNEATAPSLDELLEQMDEAAQANVVIAPEPLTGAYLFTNRVWRSQLYGELESDHRAHVHQSIARALEPDTLRSTNLSEIAAHLADAPQHADPEVAIDYLRRAAEDARRRCDHAEAIAHYRQAVDLVKPTAVDRKVKAELHVALAEILCRNTDHEESRKALDEALATVRACDDWEILARAALAPERYLVPIVVDDQGAHSALEDAFARLPPEDHPLSAALTSRLAWQRYCADEDEAEVDEMSRGAVAMARRLGHTSTLLETLIDRHRILSDPAHATERATIAREIIQTATTAEATEALATGYTLRARDLLEQGNVEAAGADMTSFEGLLNSVRRPFHDWVLTTWRMLSAALRGELSDARHHALEGLAFADKVQTHLVRMNFGAQSCVIDLLTGDLPSAQPFLESALNGFPKHGLLRSTLAYLLAQCGRHDDSRAHAARCAPGGVSQIHRGSTWLAANSLLGMAAARTGDLTAGDRLYDALLPFERRMALIGFYPASGIGMVALPLGMLALTLGHWHEAEHHLTTSLELHDGIGALPWSAMTHFEMARLQHLRSKPGDRIAARRSLSQARALAEPIGMGGLLQDCAALERRLAAPRSSNA